MILVLWVEALLLFACGVLGVLGAGLRPPEVALGARVLSDLTVRIGLGVLAAVFFVASGICAGLALRRQGLGRALALPGPRGLIFITPHTVSQLVGRLLAAELGETPFRVQLFPRGKALALRVSLRLPEEGSIPNLAERLQELLSTEVARRTGLEVQEVQILVSGAGQG